MNNIDEIKLCGLVHSNRKNIAISKNRQNRLMFEDGRYKIKMSLPRIIQKYPELVIKNFNYRLESESLYDVIESYITVIGTKASRELVVKCMLYYAFKEGQDCGEFTVGEVESETEKLYNEIAKIIRG